MGHHYNLLLHPNGPAQAPLEEYDCKHIPVSHRINALGPLTFHLAPSSGPIQIYDQILTSTSVVLYIYC